MIKTIKTILYKAVCILLCIAVLLLFLPSCNEKNGVSDDSSSSEGSGDISISGNSSTEESESSNHSDSENSVIESDPLFSSSSLSSSAPFSSAVSSSFSSTSPSVSSSISSALPSSSVSSSGVSSSSNEEPVVIDADIVLSTPVTSDEVFIPFPNFMWTSDARLGTAYKIEIARDASFSTIIDQDTVYSTRYVPDQPLPVGPIYWRVSVLSNPQKFTGQFTVVEADETVQVAYDPSSTNHQAAVDAALAQAISFNNSGKNVVINFPKGTYRCESSSRDYFMRIHGANGLILNGNGSSIHLSKYSMTTVSIQNSENVMVRGFEIDNPGHVPFVQGTVKSANFTTGEVILTAHSGASRYEDGYINTSEFLVLLDPVIDGKLKDGVANYYSFSKITKTGDDYTLTLSNKANVSNFALGDRFVHLARNGGKHPVLFSQDSTNVTYFQMTTYAASGVFFAAFNGSILNVIDCHGKIGTGRWFGLNADGIHARSLEIGPWIENTTLNGLGDDAVALYSRPSTIYTVFPNQNRKQLVIDALHFNMEPGNEVSFFNPAWGSIYAETVVKSVKSQGSRWLVEFEDELPTTIQPGSNILDNDQIWNRSKSCGDFVIRSSTFRNIRRYGTVFRAKGGVVEKNSYIATPAAAIIFINEPSYPNGLYCSEIIIRENDIRKCAFDPMPTGAISILFKNRTGGAAQSHGPKNILIENNRITDSNALRAAFMFWSTEKMLIRNNLIQEAPVNEFYPMHVSAQNVREIEYIR
jgi:hypothetical protein